MTVCVEGAPPVRLLPWPRWTPRWLRSLSMTLAPLRRIYIADGIRDERQIDAVIAHELVHYTRAWARGPWAWLVIYILIPRRRLDEEMWGEAAEALMRIEDALRPVSDADIPAYISASRLSGWTWPYYTGAEAAAVEAEIARRVREARGLT